MPVCVSKEVWSTVMPDTVSDAYWHIAWLLRPSQLTCIPRSRYHDVAVWTASCIQAPLYQHGRALQSLKASHALLVSQVRALSDEPLLLRERCLRAGEQAAVIG